MSAQTYVAIIDAIQAHVRDTHGDTMYARDWVIACGVETATMAEAESTQIRVIKSPRATAYTMTGLLSWAIELFIPTDDDED